MRAFVRASATAIRRTVAIFPTPSCESPRQKAAAKRDVAERVSQFRVGFHEMKISRRIDLTWPASTPERQNESRFSSNQAAGELTQLPDALRSCRTCGVWRSITYRN